MNRNYRRRKQRYETSQVFLQMLIIILIILVLVAAFLIHKTASPGGTDITVDNTDPLASDSTVADSSNTTKDTGIPPDIFPPDTTGAPLGAIEENPLYDGFELPINGATGYASIATEVREVPDNGYNVIHLLDPGDVFTIISLQGDWLAIEFGSVRGWIPAIQCLVNLPDVVPSVVYNDTNAYRSLFRASGFEIDGITGEKLYDAYAENPRLSRKEYIMPVLVPVAKKICAAQQSALKWGRTLVIYEAYRPFETQMTVANAVKALAKVNATVNKGLNEGRWSTSWFIATSLSNHQQGFAFDVSLGNVTKYEKNTVGKYTFNRVIEYNKCTMPTEMHELSTKAINYKEPFSSTAKTGWETLPLADTMTNDAKLLRYFCVGAGLTPLASEWWHFNDLDTYEQIKGNSGQGGFYTSICISKIPD